MSRLGVPGNAGLDAADTARFSQQAYGKASRGNTPRYVAIQQAFAHRGAVLGDVATAEMADGGGSGPAAAARSAPNDVGWRIWPGNYGNGLLTQLNASATSVGWWHVGPHDQPYGRFARGFDRAAGKVAMGFRVDRRMYGGLAAYLSSASRRELKLRLTYLDRGTASFRMYYDSTVGRYGSCKPAGRVFLGDSGRWVTIDLNIADARLAGGCPAVVPGGPGADIRFVQQPETAAAAAGAAPTAGDDVVISTIELV
eukprot:SAG22_NODE_939_length_6404_cov_3.836003_2_plen_255_part_00